ncbi:hypothetical protein CMUS01_11964 [Colletotrichum musicola]|uniref:Hydrophobin n=1 Tax=Colletotrichum musicola TaxID=2175873 RepID=A0A8H6JRV8_9PEZI|nr:hypothetical protein CMUS01_11964 [Colletotrichum musicola]
MKSTCILATLFAALAVAVPTSGGFRRQTSDGSDLDTCEDDSATSVPKLCSLGTPLCCRTDTEGLTSLDCAPPTKDLTKVPSIDALSNFYTACIIHGRGRHPRCCTLKAGGQDLLCEDPLSTINV